MLYSIGIELADYAGGKALNLLKYNSLNDVVGKSLKLSVELRKAVDIPEKLAHEVQCRYQWLDQESTEFSTSIVESKSAPVNRAPQFSYKQEHVIEIDDELISKMIENTLRIGVYGKVEQKRRLMNNGDKLHMIGDEIDVAADVSSISKMSKVIQTTKGPLTPEEIERLRQENAELLEQIKRFRETGYVPGNKTACCACAIF